MKEKFDAKLFPATAAARALNLKCNCDDCHVDQRICRPKANPPSPELKLREQTSRQEERARLAPREKNWTHPTAHEISWADTAHGRALLLLQADFINCAHIRLMVREHRGDHSLAAAGLPDIDALEDEWTTRARAKRLAGRYSSRPKRRRFKVTPSSNWS